MTHLNIKILFALALLLSAPLSPTMAMDSEPEDAASKHPPTLQELEAQLQEIHAKRQAVQGNIEQEHRLYKKQWLALVDPTGTEIQGEAQHDVVRKAYQAKIDPLEKQVTELEQHKKTLKKQAEEIVGEQVWMEDENGIRCCNPYSDEDNKEMAKRGLLPRTPPTSLWKPHCILQ